MSNLTNMQRKIVFALGILFLFVAMYPYKAFLHAEAVKRDLGEATMGEVDTGELHAQARPARRRPGHRGQRALDAGAATSRRSRTGTS